MRLLIYVAAASLLLMAGCSNRDEVILPDGTIMVTEGTETDGVQKKYTKDWQLLEEVTIKNGNANGYKKTFYSNGKEREVTPIVDGYAHGKSILYFSNGKIQQEESYVKGKKDGKIIRYWANGKVQATESYKMGEFQEDLIEYSKNGTVIEQPKISIKTKNTVIFDGKLTFTITLTPATRHYTLYASFPAPADLKSYKKLTLENGVGTFVIHKTPGLTVMGELGVYAEYITSSGLKGVAKTRMNIAE